MKNYTKALIKLQVTLLYIMPAVLFFSYYPVIKLGASDSMNFELSLPLIWLGLFALVSLLLLPKTFRRAHLQVWQIVLLILFPVYLVLSLFWSSNLLRGLLTAGVSLCLILSFFTIPYLSVNQKSRQTILKVFLISSAAVAAFCWIQSILDAAGLPTTHTLACAGCTTNTFGFPHPNGFAIEPQFMGNLLLAPTLLALYLTIHFSRSRTKFFALTLFLSTTLFFTFSRGAIYAFIAANLVIFVFEILRRNRAIFLLPTIFISALITCLLAQGAFAALSPTNDNFWSGIAKSIHQLSLGKIDFRPAENVVENTTESSAEPSISPESISSQQSHQAVFTGYVAESTDTRLALTSASLKTWSKSPTTMLIGVGIGGAGIAMYQAGEIDSPKEITQNTYTEVLLELGLIGTVLLIISAVTFILAISSRFNFKTSATAYLLALILSYALSMFFFSGLPNALHIFLLPSLALLFI